MGTVRQTEIDKTKDNDHCQICGDKLELTMIDGATVMGPWATMCVKCHKLHGRGLGVGKGQKYTLQTTSTGHEYWLKVEG